MLIGMTLSEGDVGDPLFVPFEWRVGRVFPATDVCRCSIIASRRYSCLEDLDDLVSLTSLAPLAPLAKLI